MGGKEELGGGIPKVSALPGSGKKREKNYTALHNILQLKKYVDAGANKEGMKTGIKGHGEWEVWTPFPLPSPTTTTLYMNSLILIMHAFQTVLRNLIHCLHVHNPSSSGTF